MLNSVTAAQHPHTFLYRGWEVHSTGNPYAHAILRGYVTKTGQPHPNYHYEDIVHLLEMYHKMDLKNPACVIDTNHSNSNKQFAEQIRIAKDIMHSRKLSDDIRGIVKGLMVESYIEDMDQ